MSAAAGSGSRRFVVVGGVALAAVLAFFAWSAVRAGAAELLYWENYGAKPQSISVADGNGQGGGAVNIGSYELDDPEGAAYDTVTNRLFLPMSSAGGGPGTTIAAVDLGTGAVTNFTAPGAPIQAPSGVTIDPTTRTIYWINQIDENRDNTISWAKLDGSAGGTLNTSGATLHGAYRLTIDPVGGRLYWGNTFYPSQEEAEEGVFPEPATISWASVAGTGGGNLDVSGTTPTDSVNGIAADHASGKVFWLNEEIESISYAGLTGGASGDLPHSEGAPYDGPYGLAFDSSQGKFIWGNYAGGEPHPQGAFGTLTLTGIGGSVSPNAAPTEGAQDPVIIKSPAATAAPTIARAAQAPATLSCSTGTWAADQPGGNVYQAPRTFAYQWTKDGAPISGAVAATLPTTAKGSYGCTVTAVNQAGAGAATASAAATVTPASLKLRLKKKLAKAKPGKQATFKVSAANKGDLSTGKSAKLCVKLSKSLKKSLKSICVKVGGVKGLGSKVAKLKVKVKPAAVAKTYSLKITGSGVSSKPLKVKLKVLG